MFSWILGKVLGNGISGILDGAAKIVDAVYTKDGEKLDKQAVLERIKNEPLAQQAAINLAEANNSSLFVSGWRAFIGWMCGFAFGWTYLVSPYIGWILLRIYPDAQPLPILDTKELLAILLALLGVASFPSSKGETK